MGLVVRKLILLPVNNEDADQPAQSDQHFCNSLPATYHAKFQ